MLVAMLMVAAACSADAAPAATSVPTTAAPTTVTPVGDNPLAVFGLAEIRIGDDSWTVAVADQPSEQSQGLMGVTDFGGVDGMLFTWPADINTSFWMKDTLIPLDIAFFSATGGLIEIISMVPCEEDPCPLYGPGVSYRHAVETTPGRFGDGGDLILVP
jgi:uncharacterized membrane protein (UPF0127 family)